jgi:hypothetical protein
MLDYIKNLIITLYNFVLSFLNTDLGLGVEASKVLSVLTVIIAIAIVIRLCVCFVRWLVNFIMGY